MKRSLTLLFVGVLGVTPLWAQTRTPAPVASITNAGDLPARVERLERTLSGRGLMEMFNRIDQLQREVSRLRGQLEEATNRQDDLLKRQRDLYLDLDRRISALERGGGRAPLVSSPVADTENAPVNATPTASSADPAAEEARYQAAFDVLREGNYDVAKERFRAFLTDYPNGSLAANAQYWLGEASYVTRDFDTARTDFGKVVSQFPDSPKVADALLKIGYLNYETQNFNDARAILGKLVQGYPGTSAARLASQRLERMDKEGR
ncbi:MAG: tol-pal system protein YbgF [Chromatiales bacterium]|nr:tol-pal system protein YbgF [Chromatiales bacterium]